MAVTVLLADDADVVRGAIHRLLGENDDIQIVAEASDFTDALEMARTLKPQLILVDLHMLRNTPPELLQNFGRESRLLAMSWATGSEAKALADGIGACAVIDKVNLSEELIPAILRMASGDPNQSPASAQKAATSLPPY